MIIYPRALPAPVSVQIEDIHVRSAVFPLDGDLDAAGQALLVALGVAEAG